MLNEERQEMLFNQQFSGGLGLAGFFVSGVLLTAIVVSTHTGALILKNGTADEVKLL